MRTRLFQVDVFSKEIFKGNPAAVCMLEQWPSDHVLQSIAAENNLAETAFVMPEEDEFRLRWFTPKVEVALCGHATMATGFTLLDQLGYKGPLVFRTQSGPLRVEREGDLLTMSFPIWQTRKVDAPELLVQALGKRPVEVWANVRDYHAIFSSPDDIQNLAPEFSLLERLERDALVVSAAAATGEYDFLLRFFAPRLGIPEDPVTGSAQCTVAPYWMAKLQKDSLTSFQASSRGGTVYTRRAGDRLLISGHCCLFLEGWIRL